MIVSASFTFALVFRKRIGVIILISLFWMAGGIINFVLLFYRVTPFTSSDLLLVKDGLDVATKYLNVFQYIVIGVLVVVVLGLFILFFLKTSLWAETEIYPFHSDHSGFSFTDLGWNRSGTVHRASGNCFP